MGTVSRQTFERHGQACVGLPNRPSERDRLFLVRCAAIEPNSKRQASSRHSGVTLSATAMVASHSR